MKKKPLVVGHFKSEDDNQWNHSPSTPRKNDFKKAILLCWSFLKPSCFKSSLLLRSLQKASKANRENVENSYKMADKNTWPRWRTSSSSMLCIPRELLRFHPATSDFWVPTSEFFWLGHWTVVCLPIKLSATVYFDFRWKSTLLFQASLCMYTSSYDSCWKIFFAPNDDKKAFSSLPLVKKNISWHSAQNSQMALFCNDNI